MAESSSVNMLCDVCIHLVSRLLQIEGDKPNTHVQGPVRDFIQLPTATQSDEQRLRECFVCSQMKRPIDSLDVRLRGNSNGEIRFDIYYYTGIEKIGEHFFTNAFSVQHAEQDIYHIARTSMLSSDTGSEESQALISRWFKNCRHGHLKCNIGDGKQWYPRRLLDVSEEKIRLLKTSEHAPAGSYATMSHCWGTKRFLTLTAENIHEFETGVDLFIFPKNFQDAITTTRRLGIQYIWIDSYCIIQSSESGDHKADKALDIAQMKQVYANSILNISASHGSGPENGCFVQRESLITALPCLFRSESDGGESNDEFHLYDLLHSQAYVRKLNSHQIFSRAWVLQERLLCPRVIHFGSDQLYWECQELLPACEAFPCGQKSQMMSSVFSTEDLDLARSARYTWCRIIEDYSEMQLTYPFEDKLVAIGGIAEHLAQHTNDQYIAGLFKENFFLQLCWEADSTDPRRAVKWRAPSWSWACMDSKVFLESHLLANSLYIALMYIHTTHVELENPENVYGPLRSASAVMTARLLPVTLDPDRRKPEAQAAYVSKRFFRLSDSENPLKFHLDDPANFNLSSQLVYILPICIAFVSEDDFTHIDEAIEYPNEIQQHGTIHALLVEKTSSGEYIRQGCLLSFVSSNDCFGYRDMLKAWKVTPETTLILV